MLKFDKQPLLLRQLQSRKDAESRARRKQQEGGKAKPAAPQKAAAAKRAGENLPTPDAKRAQTEGALSPLCLRVVGAWSFQDQHPICLCTKQDAPCAAFACVTTARHDKGN